MGILDSIFGKRGPRRPRRKQQATKQSDWLPTDAVFKMLKGAAAGRPQQLNVFVAQSPLRCASADGAQLVVVRDHDAWQIEGEGWADANRPPESKGAARQMVNLYQHSAEHGTSGWSKMPVPQTRRIEAVEWDGEHFVFTAAGGTVRCTPMHLRRAVGESVSGGGQSEETIERNFGKLEGTVPLEWGGDADNAADREPPAAEIDDELLGRLKYDEQANSYRIEACVDGFDLDIHIEADEKGDFQPAIDRARGLKPSFEERLRKARHYAASLLLELKNETWLGEGESPVTSEEFATRIFPVSVAVAGDGTVIIYHDDNDLFLSHCIEVTMDGNDTFVDATISG